MPTLSDSARSRLKSASVPSTYGELSMSSQKKLFADSHLRSRPRQYLKQTSGF